MVMFDAYISWTFVMTAGLALRAATMPWACLDQSPLGARTAASQAAILARAGCPPVTDLRDSRA
eukprot:CAMPEP_0179870586 /NCGR_PEP_ID=MMETSP0982-20121206/20320_1 /TAXON_ID=483367 /ORGANISM="non described non described, Strain CCMP 2436" /LENGTH=63 /DNA_ID=CAMNT_0021761097 /DNA_START=178 /DNA_END=369 /DNA_ORIENTATION=+